MRAQKQFDKEQHVETWSSISKLLRVWRVNRIPLRAFDRCQLCGEALTFYPCKTVEVRLGLLGHPQHVIMGTMNCSNNTPKKKSPQPHGFNPSLNGKHQFFICINTMEVSGGTKVGSSSGVWCTVCFQWRGTRIQTCYYMCINRLKRWNSSAYWEFQSFPGSGYTWKTSQYPAQIQP